MKYNIDYTKEDFLQFQLFTASQSSRVQKNSNRSLVVVMMIFFGIGLFGKMSGNDFLFWYMMIFVLISFFFYPKYAKSNLYKHYEGFVNENFKGRLGQTSLIEFKYQTKIIFKRIEFLFSSDFVKNTRRNYGYNCVFCLVNEKNNSKLHLKIIMVRYLMKIIFFLAVNLEKVKLKILPLKE